MIRTYEVWVKPNPRFREARIATEFSEPNGPGWKIFLMQAETYEEVLEFVKNFLNPVIYLIVRNS